MHDYDVWYESKHGKMIIGNVKADTDKKATNLAKKIYGSKVWVERS